MKIKRPLCGAKLKNGQACAKPPIAGMTRCRLHGGITKLKGAESVTSKPGGMYSKFYTEEELAAIQEMELGNVDAEIQLVRVRLQRAMEFERLDAEGKLATDIEENNGRPRKDQELDLRKEVLVRRQPTPEEVAAGTLPPMIVVSEEKQYRKIDYRAAIATMLARLESLEKTRAELAKLASMGSNEDLAAALVRLADRLPV